MEEISIQIGEEQFDAWLDDNAAPETVRKILEALPVNGVVSAWGDEFYFSIPVDVELENAVDHVSVGDLAFWPQGRAFCIFFGKTPMTTKVEKIVPASAVNPVGRIDGIDRLKNHRDGETITITLG